MQQEIKFNPEKTQFIIFGKKSKVTDIKPKMYNYEIKCVNKIKYLGVILNDKNNNKDHIDTRIKLAFKSFYTLKNLQIDNKYLATKIKIHLYKMFIRPTLIYGLENFVLSKSQIKKLQTTEATMINTRSTKRGKMTLFEFKNVLRLYSKKKILN